MKSNACTQHTIEKLAVLADAAKYDVACTSSGLERSAQKGMLGNTVSAGICHSFTPDGRCVTLLKVLMTNVCCYDCAYCVNRVSNDVPRAAFSPEELAQLTIDFFRRNYIEGLFLSSGVLESPDYTSELMCRTLELLRYSYGFRGYIHVKGIPGTSPELIDRLGHLTDRMSVNLELPSADSLGLLAPDKKKSAVFAPMRQIQQTRLEQKGGQGIERRKTTYLAPVRPRTRGRAFVPAGQSTQMIIGASPETDYHILNLSSALYSNLSLKRVFFSAYLPVNDDARLPRTRNIQLDREHRLYQADWLLRFYNFDVSEIIDEGHPFLETDIDPKANWALNHLDEFPVEVNTASYEVLLRVPGIGVKGAKAIVKARRYSVLHESQLRKLGIAYKRARYFITCNGTYGGTGVDFSRDALHAQLSAVPDGGKHGRRARKQCPGQMTLFDNEQFGEQVPAFGSARDARGMLSAVGAMDGSVNYRNISLPASSGSGEGVSTSVCGELDGTNLPRERGEAASLRDDQGSGLRLAEEDGLSRSSSASSEKPAHGWQRELAEACA